MQSFLFGGVRLQVTNHCPDLEMPIMSLLEDLSFRHAAVSEGNEMVTQLTIQPAPNGCKLLAPTSKQNIFSGYGYRLFHQDDATIVADGESWLHLQPLHYRGTAHIAESFSAKDPLHKINFWMLGLMNLMAPHGFFPLHAAALVDPGNRGVLVAGKSGSGKSTLTIGLVRAGWRYLSDDALFVRSTTNSAHALTLRKHVYIKEDDIDRYNDLVLGHQSSGAEGKLRRRIALHKTHPGQQVAHTVPRTIVFPRIVRAATSALAPIGRAEAMARLLEESSQVFQRHTARHQLQTLQQLVGQAQCYELTSGQDLYHDPVLLAALLDSNPMTKPWPKSSSN
jgi:hypothetical protein